MSARFASTVFLALGIADLAFLNLALAPRLAQEEARTRASASARPHDTKVEVVPPAKTAKPTIARTEEPKVPREPPSTVAFEVPFDFQSERVTSLPAARSLEHIAHELATSPGRKVLLRGHTDKLGRADSNLVLGRRRAEAVKRYMVMHGAPESRIAIEAVGDKEPLDSSDTPSAWAKNRRVEVVIR